MSLTHHPDGELLRVHASGAAAAEVSLLVATHLTFCPICRGEVRILEMLGGVMLSDLAPAVLEGYSLETTLATLDSATTTKPVLAHAAHVARPVPPPLRSYVGPDLDRVRWRTVVPGMAYRMLMKRGRTRVYLTRSSPGSGMGLHTHRGNELTLVLAGGFTDETGSYARGDLILTTPDIHHSPVADDDGECITLAMTDAPLKFRNPGAGLIARIFGF